MSSEKVCATSY